MTTTPVALHVQNLGKAMDNRIILDRVHLEVAGGEICVLIGANGAGKSLFIRCVLGLETLDEGSVHICGRSIQDRLHLRHHTGLVASDHIEHLSLLTPREYFDFVITIYQVAAEYASHTIETLAERLQIDMYMDTLIGNLSFGSKKKVQLLAVLLYRPQLLICDEIFEGLDPQSVDVVKELLASYPQEGRAVLFTTHIHSLAREFADRYYELHRGTITVQRW